VKSILQTALLYACVQKLRNLDAKTIEILKSFVYTFWLLKFSDHKVSEKFNVIGSAYEMWQNIIETFAETKTWTEQHILVAEALLKIFAEESNEAIRRMALITTVRVDAEVAAREINEVHQERMHHFGNMINFQLGEAPDAEMEKPR
jgi:hypothetical protein